MAFSFDGQGIYGQPVVGIVFTKNKESLFVKNGTLGTVTEVLLELNSLRVEIDGGLSIIVNTKEYDALDLAFCITTHRGQGLSVENSFMLAGVMNDRELSYVQASRARGDTRIYTDILSGGESIEELAKQMNRSRAKDMAIDYEIE